MEDIDKIIANLKRKRRSTRCKEMKNALENLGFILTKGKKGNHWTYMHPYIPEFFGSHYDCGHGRDPELLEAYVSNVVGILSVYRDTLYELGYHKGNRS